MVGRRRPWLRPPRSCLLLARRPRRPTPGSAASNPGDGAQLDTAPDQVTLEFTEPVSAELGGVRVFAADGDRVDVGARGPHRRRAIVEVDLEADLPDGAYAVTYRIVSADGHPGPGRPRVQRRRRRGRSQPARPVLRRRRRTGAGRSPRPSSASWPMRGRCWRRAARSSWRSSTTAAQSGIGCVGSFAIGAVVGAVGILAALPLLATLATGQGLGAITESGVFGEVLSRTGWVLATAPRPRRAGRPRARRPAPGAGRRSARRWRPARSRSAATPGAPTTSCWPSAPRSSTPWRRPPGSAAWSCWRSPSPAGGRSPITRRRRAMVGRFSLVATVSVTAVGLAGVVLSWSEVRAAVRADLHHLRLDPRWPRSAVVLVVGPDRGPQPVPRGAGHPAVTHRAPGLVAPAPQRAAGGPRPGRGRSRSPRSS